MTMLSIDPGDTTGLAIWGDGVFYRAWELPSNDVLDYLSARTQWGRVVCEDFRLRADKALSQVGSRFETAQVIGAARLAARIAQAEFVTQSPNILRITAMHYGIVLPAGHVPDRVSAALHGLHYYEGHGYDTKMLRELNPTLQNLLS